MLEKLSIVQLSMKSRLRSEMVIRLEAVLVKWS